MPFSHRPWRLAPSSTTSTDSLCLGLLVLPYVAVRLIMLIQGWGLWLTGAVYVSRIGHTERVRRHLVFTDVRFRSATRIAKRLLMLFVFCVWLN